MKLAKAPQSEIDALMQWLQDREGKEDGPPPFMRVVFGYETLVQNCCDPAKDYLDFKPETLECYKDKARLDFIQSNHSWLTRSKDDAGTEHEWRVSLNMGAQTFDASTARAAIDAAMESTNPSK